MDKSIKHLEFQLQREKTLTHDLEQKCKELSAQVSQLEQDKAELRREKIAVSDEAKKSNKLEERIHSLVKEIEQKDAIIQNERLNAANAKAETEEVRQNAKRTISSWTKAEEQWIAEQECLNTALKKYQSETTAKEEELVTLKRELDTLKREIASERERNDRLQSIRDTLEQETKTLHLSNEKQLNRVYDLEQTIYTMDLAGDKQKEALNMKDIELQKLRAEIEKHIQNEEKLEQTINSLNDKLNATKMVNMEEKTVNEKLNCDILDVKKETAHLKMSVESLKKENSLVSQKYEAAQKNMDELKEKLKSSQDEVKEKNSEIRKIELSLSQLKVEVNRQESEINEWIFRHNSLKRDFDEVKAGEQKLKQYTEELLASKKLLSVEINTLKSNLDAMEEKFTLEQHSHQGMVSALNQEIKNLEQEIKDRQRIVTELTEELAASSEKSASYYTKILKENECLQDSKREIERLRRIILASEQEHFQQGAELERHLVQHVFLEELNDIACSRLKDLQDRLKFKDSCLSEVHYEMKQKEVEVEKLHMEKNEALEKICQLKALLSETQEDKSRVDAENSDLRNEVQRLTSDLNGAENHSEWQKEREANLLHKVESLEANVEKCESKIATMADASTDQAKMFQIYQSLVTHYYQVVEYKEVSFFEAMEEKVKVLYDVFKQNSNFFQDALASKDKENFTLTKKCQDLERFVKDAKIAANRLDQSAAGKYEKQRHHLEVLQKENSSLVEKNTTLLSQLKDITTRLNQEAAVHLEEIQSKELQITEINKSYDDLKTECERIRNGLNYEVKRKCEYKSALEETKKLKQESEQHRKREKELSKEAIEKANNEAVYWLLCFEKLKNMVEESWKTGSRVPSLDRTAVSRLQEARTNSDYPLSTKAVNMEEKPKKARETLISP